MDKFKYERKCPKCGGNTSDKWMKPACTGDMENIKRECLRCGYLWFEKTLDSNDDMWDEELDGLEPIYI